MPEKLSNNFNLGHRISKDDLGSIYLGEQLIPQRKVLVKVYVLAEINEQFPEYFKTASQDHPRISLYKDDKALYAVIEKKDDLPDLYSLEISALEKWLQDQEKKLMDIEDLLKNVKKMVPQRRRSDLWKHILIGLTIVSVLGLSLAGLQNTFFRYMRELAEIKVPDVTNKTVLDAQKTLEDLGLEGVIVASVPSQTIPKDLIVSHFPEAGAVVKTGRKVKLKVSSGKEELNIPDLAGRDPEQVGVILKKLNLNLVVDEANAEFSRTIPKGRIITQNITPFTSVMEGTTIKVDLSKGFPVKLSAVWEDERKENVLVKINCFLPHDWPESPLKIISNTPPESRRTILEDTILPGGAFNKNFTEVPSAVIEVYYGEDLAFKQSLKEVMLSKEKRTDEGTQ
ncbi:MAG: PASTA domain-containing protein [Candidatus Margulisiibacteriota bacterium]|jgi:hypothetical protein